MKLSLTQILLISVGVLLITVYFSISTCNKYRNKYKSQQSTIETLVLNNQQQEEYSAKQFKKLYSKIDSLATSLNISSKNIEHVIINEYRFKDTVVTKTNLVNTTMDKVKYFMIGKSCYTIEGLVTPDSITVNAIDLKDKLTTFLYKYRPYKFWFIKYGRWRYSAKMYSECKGDTISIQKNIKISR